MLSICIPVFNFDITSLILELSKQAKALNIPYEIIVIDDCSEQFKDINKQICKKHTYIELPENIGRAKIRNLFLKYARYEYLLFLDCDSSVKNGSFLANYIAIIPEKPAVVCGGRVYDTLAPQRDHRLRWKYGILRESQPCSVRQQFPNKSFMTNNFIIRKEILAENRFDERIKQYGHEDTLFGIVLKNKHIPITHIDNPVLNGDVETNIEYLRKTKESVLNLVHLLAYKEYENLLTDEITLLHFYRKINKVEELIYIIFKVFKPFLLFFLKKGYIRLYLFDFYKLGIFMEGKKKKNQ